MQLQLTSRRFLGTAFASLLVLAIAFFAWSRIARQQHETEGPPLAHAANPRPPRESPQRHEVIPPLPTDRVTADITKRMAIARGAEVTLPPIAQEISDAADKMTPDQAEALLKRLKTDVSDLRQRAALGRQIISSLCINGYPEEAWKLIEPGFGEARNEQLRGFFTFGSKNDPNAIVKLNELSDPREHNVALEGFLSHRELSDFANIDFKALGIDSPDERRIVTDQLNSCLASFPIGIGSEERKQLTLDVLNAGVGLVNSGVLTPGELGRLLETERSLNSFEDMAILGNLNASKDTAFNGTLDAARSGLVKQMVQEDAPQTLNVLLSDKELQKNPGLVETAIFEWLERDNGGATQWYLDNGSRLQGNQRDSVLSAFAKTAIKYKELDTARKWVEEIGNPEVKKKFTSQLEPAKVK